MGWARVDVWVTELMEGNRKTNRKNKNLSDGDSRKTTKLFSNNHILSCQFILYTYETTTLNVPSNIKKQALKNTHSHVYQFKFGF